MDICVDCGREWPADRFNKACANPGSCFSCRSKGISLALQGGKEYWNGDTEKRRADRAISEAKAAGFDPVPVHTAGNWGAASAIRKAPEVSASVGAFGSKLATPGPSVASTTKVVTPSGT